MTRDKNSKAAERMREYRKRKKEKALKEMKERGISGVEAEKKYMEETRKKGREQKRESRMKLKKPQKVSFMDMTNVDTQEEEEKKENKVEFKVEKFINLNDDKISWSSLSEWEKRLIDKMKKKAEGSSIRSLIQYLNRVKHIYKKLDKVFKGTNINVLTNTEDIDNLLRNYKGKKDYYSSIISVLRAYPLREKYVEYYTKKMKSEIKEVEKQTKLNMKSVRQQDNWIKYDNVIKLFKKNKHILNDNDRLLLTLIIYYPRRVQDWQKMKLHKKGKKDPNYNYLNLNKRGEPTTFDFLRSKSQEYEKLGTNQAIPTSVKRTISEYIRKRQTKNNELLFSTREGIMYSSDGFSKKIKQLFKVITGKNINSNTWRHIVATNLSDKKVSLLQREKKANEMGHSLMESLKYVKN
jgi:hypothetical protein